MDMHSAAWQTAGASGGRAQLTSGPKAAAWRGHDVALLQDLGKHIPRLLACTDTQAGRGDSV